MARIFPPCCLRNPFLNQETFLQFRCGNNRKLRIKALPANLPDFIEIDITPLKIGDKVAVGDLPGGDYTFLQTENTVVCRVSTSRVAIEDEEAEEARLGSEEVHAPTGPASPLGRRRH